MAEIWRWTQPERDWLQYNASYVVADESFGFRRVGKNVKIHNSAIIPEPRKISIGSDVRIDAFTILSAREIFIGSYVHIGAHCVLSGRGKIEFEDFSCMSHGAQIFTSTDDLSIPCLVNTTVPTHLQAVITKDVIIEKHALIGAGAIVMPGVRLGRASVAGVMSYVRDDVEPFHIVGGIPAKVISTRLKLTGPNSLEALERRCWGSKISALNNE